MCLACLFERQDAIDDGPQAAGGEERRQVPSQALRRDDLLLERTRAEDRSKDAEAAAQHDAEIDLGTRAGATKYFTMW